MDRISSHKYFLEIAIVISKKSTCLRHKVGSILVKNNQILSTGYNGAAKGLEHCIDIGCIRDDNNIESGKNHEICRAIHAEQNTIINAAKQGTSIKDSICYCTHAPCIICTKMLINAEISKVYYLYNYPNSEINNIIGRCNIDFTKIEI